jgi:sorting nexin-25
MSYLMEFMDRRGRALLVQFWLTVESFKDPLESVDDDDDNDSASFVGSQDPVSETILLPATNDLTMLCQLYFSQATIPPVLSIIPSRHIDSIRTFLGDNAPSPQIIRRAKRAILLAQRQVEKEMENDFLEFKKSDLWFTAAKNAQVPQAPPDINLDPPGGRVSSVSQQRTSSGFSAQPPSISNEDTESILEESIGNLRSLAVPMQRGSSTSKFALLVEPEQGSAAGRTPLFGDAENQDLEQTQQMLDIQAALTDIIGDNRGDESPPQDFSKPSQATSTRRHESEDDLLLSSQAKGEDEKPPEVFETRQMIDTLGRRIDRLRSERNILDALMRKAELAGDKRKLELFDKSHTAMDRDLRELSFQKSQFEQQMLESEFSLERVKVAIVDSSTEDEESRPVVRYLIEVKQLGLDNSQVSGWVVARRYNEFLAMHQRLKEKYVVVKSLEFPGKRLVTSISSAFLEGRKNGLEKYLQVGYIYLLVFYELNFLYRA